MKFKLQILMASLVALSLNSVAAHAVTSGNSSTGRDYKEELEVYSVANDSDVVYDQYDSLYFLDKDKVKKGKNLATSEFNASNYILEKRVRDYGDTVGVNFRKLWYTQIGLGASQIAPASPDYKMNILTSASVGIGKLLNGYNSLRLSVDGGIGYFNNSNNLYLRLGGRLDYLFSFSNYVYGYKPTRKFDLSSVVGVGFDHNMYDGGYDATVTNTPEAHLGLQFKFFTGPQGYFVIEPYAGVGDRNMDMSYAGSGNVLQKDLRGSGYWRQYDLFYGVNMGFIYFLNNNLTPNELALYHLKKTFNEFTHEDSVKYELLKNYKERTPWFIQTAAGAEVTYGMEGIDMLRTMGHRESFSIGKWISSRFGLRGSFVSKQTTRQRDSFGMTHAFFYGGTYYGKDFYTRDNHSVFQGFTVEAMVNLGGFRSNYNWDSGVGASLYLGAGAGTMTNYYTNYNSRDISKKGDGDKNAANQFYSVKKDNASEFSDVADKYDYYYVNDVKRGQYNRYLYVPELEDNSYSYSASIYTAGLNLWAKLSQDLQFFIEPRWNFYVYKKFGSEVDTQNDQDFSLSLGLTMNIRSKSYREKYDYEFEYDKKLYVGLGGGLNFEYTKGDYEWVNNMYNYNGLAFVGYRFNKFHGLRFSAELMSITQNSIEKTLNWNLSSHFFDEPLRNPDGTLNNFGQKYYPENMETLYSQESYEQWTRDYFVAIPSLSYTFNLLNLISGYKPHRKTNLDLVVGPSAAFLVGEQHQFFGYYQSGAYAYVIQHPELGLTVPQLPSELGHFFVYPTISEENQAKYTEFGFGGHIGLNLLVNISKNIGAFASPMFYIFGNKFKFSTDEFIHSNRVLMSGNIGLTYTF